MPGVPSRVLWKIPSACLRLSSQSVSPKGESEREKSEKVVVAASHHSLPSLSLSLSTLPHYLSLLPILFPLPFYSLPHLQPLLLFFPFFFSFPDPSSLLFFSHPSRLSPSLPPPLPPERPVFCLIQKTRCLGSGYRFLLDLLFGFGIVPFLSLFNIVC